MQLEDCLYLHIEVVFLSDKKKYYRIFVLLIKSIYIYMQGKKILQLSSPNEINLVPKVPNYGNFN